MGEFKSGPAM